MKDDINQWQEILLKPKAFKISRRNFQSKVSKSFINVYFQNDVATKIFLVKQVNFLKSHANTIFDLFTVLL